MSKNEDSTRPLPDPGDVEVDDVDDMHDWDHRHHAGESAETLAKTRLVLARITAVASRLPEGSSVKVGPLAPGEENITATIISLPTYDAPSNSIMITVRYADGREEEVSSDRIPKNPPKLH